MKNEAARFRAGPWCICVLLGAALPLPLVSGCAAGPGGGPAPSGTSPAGTTSKSFVGSLSFGAQTSTAHSMAFKGTGQGGLTLQDMPVKPPSLKVVCTGADGTQATGLVDATGAFSVAVDGLPNPVTCDLLTADDTHYATFLFPTEHKALDGSALRADALTITGDVDVGSVTVNTSAGEATAGVIASNPGVASFDPTGEYAVAAPPSVPTGYVGPCPAGSHHNDGPDACHGPQIGDSMYLKLLTGKAFAPDATCSALAQGHGAVSSCAGTASTDPAYAVMVWNSRGAFEACGGRLGFTFDEAKAYANIDLSSSGVNEGAPQWSTTLPDGKHLLANGWEVEEATAQWDIADCAGAAADDGTNVWICRDHVHGTYSIGKGGGCTDAAGHDVFVTDWSSLGNPVNCTNSAETISLAGQTLGLNKNVCTYASGMTCTGDGAIFTKDGTGAFAATTAMFDYKNGSLLVAQGGSCGDAGLAGHELARLQCYADAYRQEAQQFQNEPSVCMRDLRTNWGADDPAKFILNDGPAKAVAQFAAERAEFPAPGVMHFFHEQDDFQGVKSGSNSWEPCHTREHLSIFVRQLGGTSDLEVRYVQETVLLDADKPICAAAAQNGQLALGSMRGIFDFTKK